MVLAFAVAAPASADRPVRGCGEGGFEPLTFAEYREILVAGGLTEEEIAQVRAVWGLIDHNADDTLCMKPKTDTPGHAGGDYNAVDNTSNH